MALRMLEHRPAPSSFDVEEPRRVGRLLSATAVVALTAGVVIGSGLLRAAAPAVDPQATRAVTAAPPSDLEGHTATAEGAASQAGPRATSGGVGVGFSPDEAGAVAAATTYHVGFGDLSVLLDDDRRSAALEAVAAAGAHEELSSSLARGAAVTLDGGIAPADVRLQRQAPLGYQVRTFTDDTATVAVWTVHVFSFGVAAPLDARWSTTDVELVWERGDWRLVGFTSQEGPVPELQGDGEHLRTIEAIERFTEYAHAPA